MAWVEHTSGQHWRVRYRRADGTVTSEGGFTTPTTAHARAREIEIDQHRGAFYDPTLGRITINEWLSRWWNTLTLDETTLENYHYLITTHVTPRFGHIPLGELRASDVTSWAADLHAVGYQHSTIVGIVSLFRRILGDAVEDALSRQPIHPHCNRGTRAFRIHHEMLWATPEEVLRGAQQAEQLHTRTSALLIITAAWTGCHWGELAALQRHKHPS